MRGVCLNHINIGVYVKRILIPIIGQLFKIIDTPLGFRAKLSVSLDFFCGILQLREGVQNIAHNSWWYLSMF